MVCITVKTPAVQGKAQIKASRSYPNADFDEEVPDFMELEEWVEGLLATAGYDTANFQLLLDGTPLTNANTTKRLSGMARVAVKIDYYARAPAEGTSPESMRAAPAPSAAPADHVEQTQGLASSGRAHNESLLLMSGEMRAALGARVEALTTVGGRNLLISTAQPQLQQWQELKETGTELALRGYDVLARDLLDKAETSFASSIQKAVEIRSLTRKVSRCLEAFSRAAGGRNCGGAQPHIRMAAAHLATLEKTTEIAQLEHKHLMEELHGKALELRKEHNLKRAAQGKAAVATAATGVVGAGAFAGAGVAGLTSTVATGLLGLGTATVWNPAGLVLLGAGTVLAGASVAAGVNAAGCGHDKESANLAKQATEEIEVATETRRDLWKFMSGTTQMIETKLKFMESLSDTDLEAMVEDFTSAVGHLQTLTKVQDEHLVWMNEAQPFQVVFDVRVELGGDRYDAIKKLMCHAEAAQQAGTKST